MDVAFVSRAEVRNSHVAYTETVRFDLVDYRSKHQVPLQISRRHHTRQHLLITTPNSDKYIKWRISHPIVQDLHQTTGKLRLLLLLLVYQT